MEVQQQQKAGFMESAVWTEKAEMLPLTSAGASLLMWKSTDGRRPIRRLSSQSIHRSVGFRLEENPGDATQTWKMLEHGGGASCFYFLWCFTSFDVMSFCKVIMFFLFCSFWLFIGSFFEANHLNVAAQVWFPADGSSLHLSQEFRIFPKVFSLFFPALVRLWCAASDGYSFISVIFLLLGLIVFSSASARLRFTASFMNQEDQTVKRKTWVFSCSASHRTSDSVFACSFSGLAAKTWMY